MAYRVFESTEETSRSYFQELFQRTRSPVKPLPLIVGKPWAPQPFHHCCDQQAAMTGCSWHAAAWSRSLTLPAVIHIGNVDAHTLPLSFTKLANRLPGPLPMLLQKKTTFMKCSLEK